MINRLRKLLDREAELARLRRENALYFSAWKRLERSDIDRIAEVARDVVTEAFAIREEGQGT